LEHCHGLKKNEVQRNEGAILRSIFRLNSNSLGHDSNAGMQIR